MKLNKFLLAALAAASLTACSDSTDVEKGNGAQWNSDGTGYVSLSLNLPTTKSTGMRAINDLFNDGTAAEYKVDKAILVLFGSAADKSENDATFLGAYSLPSTFTKDNNSSQITAVSKITRKINKTDMAKVYAYVILNPTSDFTGNSTTSTDYTATNETKLTINGTDVTDATKFGTFKDLIITKFQDASSNFVMTNAPLADKDGKVEVMSKLDVSCIKSTAADAAAHPAAAIYVERAAAKVTLKSSVTTMSTNIEGRKTFNVKVLGWKLDNTNTEAYATRKVDADATTGYMNYVNKVPGHRFYGTTPVASTDAAGNTLSENSKRYRTYWANDVNYADGKTEKLSKSDQLYASWDDANKDNISNTTTEHPAYCFENTFDVAHMTFDNTTRAIVAVQIGDDASDHYMYNNDMATYNACGTDNATMKADLLAKINTLPAVQDLGTATVVTLNTATNGTSCTIKSVKVGSTTIDETTNRDVLDVITSYFGTISIYKNAIAYYPVRIKHFGDDLTPWNNNEDSNLPTASNIYPGKGTYDSAAKYLGRYGVLRNNWYELNVTGIQNIGTSNIPERGGSTDDTIESYISVTINVLSWAKRTQDVTLQ